MSFNPDKFLDILRGLPAAQRYWVGFSGGLDSSVLLTALAQQREQLAGTLHAVHVNHHIHAQSSEWQAHCQARCRELGILLECRDIMVIAGKGESLEAVARAKRYAVYRELLGAGDMLLLAHHQNDQMETFLLQALRGAGLRGLAAMPRLASLGNAKMARPLLGFARSELHAWAVAQSLTWIEDPGNVVERFDRNYLRHRVIPAIRERWPSAAATLGRSAGHCAEALEVLAIQAEQDWERCADSSDQSLAVAGLNQMGRVRTKNLLRHWFDRLGLPQPPAHKLEQVFSEVLPARADRNPCVSWEGTELRRYRHRLFVLRPAPDAPCGEYRLFPDSGCVLESGLGQLHLITCVGGGLRARDCPADGFRVCFRSGGERCQPAGRAYHRPLKKWLQERGVVPWMRERLPLIYAGEELAAVADLFVCAPFAAEQEEPGLRILWRAHPLLY